MAMAVTETGTPQHRKVCAADYLLIATCTLIAMVDGFDTQLIAYTAPALSREFGLSAQEMGMIFSAGLFGGLCGAPLTVFLEHRLGRRLMLLLCLCAFALGSGLTALSTSGNILIVIRFFSGIGLGMAIPLLLGTMTDSLPASIRARGLALVTCAIPGGALIGGLIAAQMIERYGWRSLFWIGCILPLVLIPALVRKLPQTLVPYASADAGTRDPVFERVRQTFGEGGLALAILLVANLTSMLLTYSLMTWGPTIMAWKGLTESTAAVAGGLLNGGSMIAILVFGYLIDRLGAALLPLVTYSIGAVLLLVLAHGALGSGSSLVVITLVGFFALGSQIAINYLLAHSVSAPRRVTVLSIAMIFSRAGASIGPLCVGALAQRGWGATALISLAAVVVMVVASLIILAERIQCRRSPLTGGPTFST